MNKNLSIIFILFGCIASCFSINNTQPVENERIKSLKLLKQKIVITYSDSAGFANFSGDTFSLRQFYYDNLNRLIKEELYHNSNYTINNQTNWQKTLDRYTNYVNNTNKIELTFDSTISGGNIGKNQILYTYTPFDSIESIVTSTFNIFNSAYVITFKKTYEYFPVTNKLKKLTVYDSINPGPANQTYYTYAYTDSTKEENFYILDTSTFSFFIAGKKFFFYRDNNLVKDSSVYIDRSGSSRFGQKAIYFYTVNQLDSMYLYSFDSVSNGERLQYIFHHTYFNHLLTKTVSLYIYNNQSDTDQIKEILYDADGDITSATVIAEYDSSIGFKPYNKMLYFYDDYIVPTYLSNNLQSVIKLYPNPTNGVINIKGPEDIKSGTNIFVFDIKGKILGEVHLNSAAKSLQIDLSKFVHSDGTYYITLFNELNSSSFPVIFKK